MRPKLLRQKQEPTIALINIVFLMLIFFMVAGTLSPPIDPDLTLVDTRDLDGKAPDYALVIHADGRMSYRNADIGSVTPYLSALEDRSVARIMPDRNAPAPRLLEIARELRGNGVEKVLIVTEKNRS